MRPGETIDVVDGLGHRASGVVAVVAGPALVEVDVHLVSVEPEPSVRVVVVQGLLKGDSLMSCIEMLTEVGVDEIVPWQAQRSVVRWSGERGQKGAARLASAVTAAGKQSRRARFPLLSPLSSTAQVAARVAGSGQGLVLHESAEAPLTGRRLPRTGEVVLVVGPEGGIAEEELRALTATNSTPVRLGPTVLRGQTAGTAAAAVVLAGTGRWD